jgi:hypothetical protein
MLKYEVRQGDCLATIGERYGFTWSQIWSLPENTTLRQKRRDPNILYPGDIVMIPDRTVRLEDRPVDKRHKFVKKTLPVSLRLRVLAQGKPIANAVYMLHVGDVWFTGQTDGDGELHQKIPHEATVGLLKLTKQGIEFPLEIGKLDPISEIEGVQARLNNLGFYCGAVDGVIGPMTRSALSMFQETWKLKTTGEADEETRAKLKEKYGC